jgi:deoxyribonuclease IV
MPRIGAHMSIAGGYYKAVLAAADLGMDTVQIFTKNNSQWRAKEITDAEVEQFQSALAALQIEEPVAHASYLINLASPTQELRQKSIDGMVVELTRAERLGIRYVVVHPGAYTTTSEEAGIEAVARAIDEIHARLPLAEAFIALEITAGQGSCLGCKFEHLAAIIGQTKQSERVFVCFDTCHAFAAGYDLRDAKSYRATWRAFDDTIGLDKLKAIHLNDSKRELGSRVDRHAHIGHGHIGHAGFRLVLRDRRLRAVPMFLETPKADCNGEPWDAVNLRTLRELAKR